MVGKRSGDRGFDRHEAVMFKHRAEPPFPMGPMGQFERGPFVFRGPRFPAAAATAGAWRTDHACAGSSVSRHTTFFDLIQKRGILGSVIDA